MLRSALEVQVNSDDSNISCWLHFQWPQVLCVPPLRNPFERAPVEVADPDPLNNSAAAMELPSVQDSQQQGGLRYHMVPKVF
mmetsp:Transcript_41962/g.91006  ORF Transcript_41962/g.91006 Transcript_41962/m.91006 type:complete len:82 (+) Transcript_41962:226-471(+)